MTTFANAADLIVGKSSLALSNSNNKLIGIPNLIRGRIIVFDRFSFKLPSKQPINRHGVNSAKR